MIARRNRTDNAHVGVVSMLDTRNARNSRFIRTLFQFGKRTTGKAAKSKRGRVELLGVVGAAGLERSEPAPEARELIWR
jgi:hypothetical protein